MVMTNSIEICTNYNLELDKLISKTPTVTSEEDLLQIFGDVFKICYDYKVEKVKLSFSELKIIITIENGSFYEVPFIEFNNENSSMNVSNSIMGKDYAVKFIKDCYNNFKY